MINLGMQGRNISAPVIAAHIFDIYCSLGIANTQLAEILSEAQKLIKFLDHSVNELTNHFLDAADAAKVERLQKEFERLRTSRENSRLRHLSEVYGLRNQHIKEVKENDEELKRRDGRITTLVDTIKRQQSVLDKLHDEIERL